MAPRHHLDRKSKRKRLRYKSGLVDKGLFGTRRLRHTNEHDNKGEGTGRPFEVELEVPGRFY